jgi:hypothetical protein
MKRKQEGWSFDIQRARRRGGRGEKERGRDGVPEV